MKTFSIILLSVILGIIALLSAITLIAVWALDRAYLGFEYDFESDLEEDLQSVSYLFGSDKD